jgi:hypothetical protein
MVRRVLPFSESPLSGKLRFKLRTLNNFFLVLAVFVPFVILMAQLSSPHFWIAWVSDIVFIALLYYLYAIFLDKRPIWIRCRHCRKKIATNTPWICGGCGAKNEHVDYFPFVSRCEKCRIEPKAYQCHHEKCGKLIFLTKDELVRNYSFCINPPVVATEEQIERTNFEREKRRAEYKRDLARLNTDVELAERAHETAKKKGKAETPEEKIKEHRDHRRAKTVSATEIYRAERKSNEEKYRDDPEMLKWVNEDLEDWYKSGDWERII